MAKKIPAKDGAPDTSPVADFETSMQALEDLVGVARYIVANPVRAGLVNRVGEYPYWDAVWLDS